MEKKDGLKRWRLSCLNYDFFDFYDYYDYDIYALKRHINHKNQRNHSSDNLKITVQTIV
jgi:hypothetical protein